MNEWINWENETTHEKNGWQEKMTILSLNKQSTNLPQIKFQRNKILCGTTGTV